MASASCAINPELKLAENNPVTADFSRSSGEEYEPDEDETEDENEDELNQPAKHVNKLQCTYDGCGLTFRRLNILERHVYQTHNKEKKYACTYEGCDKRYIIADHLTRHIRRFHEKKHIITGTRFKCTFETCERFFNTQTSVRRHVREFHESRKTYKCTDCDFITTHKGNFSKHAKKHDPNKATKSNTKVYNCPDCAETFKKWSELQKHRKVSHIPTCPICQHTFKYRQNMKTHMRLHEQKEKNIKYTCTHEGCDKFYWQRNNLNHHIQAVHEGMRIKCPVECCDRTFTTTRKMKNHIKLHTEGNLMVERKSPATRKDKGKKKLSAVAVLTGFDLDDDHNKLILNNRTDDIELDYESFTTTSDTDGEEIHVPRRIDFKIKNEQKSVI